MTTITALPTPVPQRSDPTNFAARADLFLAALPTFATETNLVASEVNANASTASSQAGIAVSAANAATDAAAQALAAANFISALIVVALTAKLPLKIPGKAKTLLI